MWKGSESKGEVGSDRVGSTSLSVALLLKPVCSSALHPNLFAPSMEYPVSVPTFTCTPEGTPKPLTSPSGNPAGPGGTTSTPGVSVTHSILEGLAPHAMMCLSCPSQGEVSRAMTYHLVGRERQPTEESERGQPTAGPQSSDFLCGWLANYRNSCPQGGGVSSTLREGAT